MGESILILLYGITLVAQYALSKISWNEIRDLFPLHSYFQFEPFYSLRKIPFFRFMLKQRRGKGSRESTIRLMAFSFSAVVSASITVIFVINYANDFPLLSKIFYETKSSVLSAFVMGILYAALLYAIRLRMNLYAQTITLYLVMLILLPSLMLNWLAKIALVGTLAKVISMLFFHYFLESKPGLKRWLVLLLSFLGIVGSRYQTNKRKSLSRGGR
jgi:hypothetical protein